MRLIELRRMLSSTADAAFAVDGEGVIVAWNNAAHALFGVSPREALGRPCRELVRGTDECGLVCAENCAVIQAVRQRRPVANFDVQLSRTADRPWCNFYVLHVDAERSDSPYAVHLVRSVDIRKRLESALRDFVVASGCVPREQVESLFARARTPARAAGLSGREIEVLRLLASGTGAAQIAERLGISRVTVKNHIQHAMRKLGARSRLAAVLRAEHAGLL
ncbi:MAG: LuxR C-terminal-related transcriptional regulator [Acidobacteriota bacterium]